MENKFNLRGKRKKCVEIIAEMGKAMSFPKEIINEMEQGLNLSIASDELVDALYAQLVEMLSKCSPTEMSRWVDEAKSTQN